jgi:hypothetical protein
MKTLWWGMLLGFVVAVAGCSTEQVAGPPARPAVTIPTIEYNNAGLESVELHDGYLVAAWHTAREGPLVPGKPTQSYERREYRAQLTPSQAAQVSEWLWTYGVFDLTEPNKLTGTEPQPIGFKSRLLVKLPDRQLSLRWTSEDTWPLKSPREAGDALLDLCKRFEREKETAERLTPPAR